LEEALDLSFDRLLMMMIAYTETGNSPKFDVGIPIIQGPRDK